MAGVVLGGCSSDYTFTDSVNSRGLVFMPRSEFGDELSTPYVVGARFTIFIQYTQRSTDMTGWRVAVTNPAVLAISEDGPVRLDEATLSLEVVASGIGTAELLLIDPGGEVQGSAALEVRMPSRVKLFVAAIAALGGLGLFGIQQDEMV